MQNNNKHRVMSIAHRMYTNNLESKHSLIAYSPQLEWQNALKRAWYFERLRKALSKGVVRFSYFKADGSIREAVGTTCNLLIPTEKHPKGTSQARENLISISYFDFERQDWRGFRMESFIGFVDVWQLTPMTGNNLRDLRPVTLSSPSKLSGIAQRSRISRIASTKK